MGSLTREYVLLALAEKMNLFSVVRINNYVATVAAGICELEQMKVIELEQIQSDNHVTLLSGDMKITVKTELPSDLYYLETMYTIIMKSEKKTVSDVLINMQFDFKSGYSSKYITNLIDSLKTENLVKEEKKKGFLGIEKVEYDVDQGSIKQMTQSMLLSTLDDTLNEQDSLLLYLLMKTDMLACFYNAQESKLIKDKLQGFQNNNALKEVIQLMDELLIMLFAMISFIC